MKKVCRILSYLSFLFYLVCFVSCHTHTILKYTVTYKTEYDSAPESITVFENTILTEEELPTLFQDGYTFGGWFDQDDVQAVADEYKVINNVTLTAKWTIVELQSQDKEEEQLPEPEYSVTYKTDYGTAPTDTAKYKKDTEVTVAAAVSYTGYTFDGWSDGSTIFQSGDKYKMGAKDVVFTALWTANTAGITVSLPEVSSESITLDHSICVNTVTFTATAIENAIYKWFLDGEIMRDSSGTAFSENSITIDTDRLSPAIYEILVTVIDGTKTYTAKQNLTVKK